MEFKKDLSLGGGLDGNYPRYVFVEDEGSSMDKSYIMAYELLLHGLPVIIKPILISDEEMKANDKDGYVHLERATIKEILAKQISNGALEEFKDKNTYNIKFITSGAYENFEYIEPAVPVSLDDESLAIHEVLTNLAVARGDAIALLEMKKDFIDNKDLIDTVSSFYVNDNYKYAACFYPWCSFSTSARKGVAVQMPACFAYLMAYANSVKTNANWLAASGVTRGAIPSMIKPLYEVGESLMHFLQGDDNQANIRINPIMNTGAYGYRIWGNRVVSPTSAILESQYTDFLNIRILMCDIKKQVYHAAMRTTFEPNDDIVWINFKALANTLLDKMKSGRGISWYKWIKEKADNKATIKATLTIRPIEAVESFDINVVLSNEEIELQEVESEF